MNEITMGDDERRSFQQVFDYATNWCKQHQWEIGVAEMALGAAAIAWGVQNGTIEMGKHIVGSAFSQWNIGEQVGGGIGGVLGSIGGAVLGSIGVVGMGGAIGIPAAIVIGGGTLLLGAAGYTVGDLTYKFLNPSADFGQFFTNASVMAVGVAFLIDGARRVTKDERVLAAASRVMNGIIYLTKLTTKVVANNISELQKLMQELISLPDSRQDAAGNTATAAAATIGGAVVGSSIAAGTVTVLGSHVLGAAALSLGLVSAPVWPVIAAGTAGLGIGYAAWKSVKFLGAKMR